MRKHDLNRESLGTAALAGPGSLPRSVQELVTGTVLVPDRSELMGVDEGYDRDGEALTMLLLGRAFAADERSLKHAARLELELGRGDARLRRAYERVDPRRAPAEISRSRGISLLEAFNAYRSELLARAGDLGRELQRSVFSHRDPQRRCFLSAVRRLVVRVRSRLPAGRPRRRRSTSRAGPSAGDDDGHSDPDPPGLTNSDRADDTSEAS